MALYCCSSTLKIFGASLILVFEIKINTATDKIGEKKEGSGK